MNNAPLLAPDAAESNSNDNSPQLWLIRAGKQQKAFVAKALELIERLDTWQEHVVTPEAVAEVEFEAERLGFPEVCAAMCAVGQMLVTYNARSYQHPNMPATLAPVPASAARPLSALLLRVYLTGTDTGGADERQQVQELVGHHMQLMLPSAGYLKCSGN